MSEFNPTELGNGTVSGPVSLTILKTIRFAAEMEVATHQAGTLSSARPGGGLAYPPARRADPFGPKIFSDRTGPRYPQPSTPPRP